jgi:hypothetical protein
LLATFDPPFWARLAIYVLWGITAILMSICGTAIALEESARRKRQGSSEDNRY